MSSINDLLNHNPAPARRPSQTQTQTTTTTFEAADALTTLATLGGGQQYAPARELPSPSSPTAFSSAPPRRSSSFGSHRAPIEPSPPVEQPQIHSPTLEQYHHGSKSPEEHKRRQSFLSRSSPAPVLAPIQNWSSALQDQMQDGQTPTAIGKDVSHILPPSSPSSKGGEASRDTTQNREPAYVRDEPTTSQIREPESVNTTPRPSSAHAPPSQSADARLPSPQPFIKNEPSGTPRENTPATVAATLERQSSIAGENLDADTLKALEIAKQSDLGLRAKRTGSVSESVASPTDSKSALAPSKKRPAPSSAPAVKKKGTAKAMKPSKKRKIDPEDGSTARSVTPTSRPSKSTTSKAGKKGSQAGTPALESSPAPDNSSQVQPSDDEGESSEDHNLYCICRKPDNHKWMIGCDGGCDDWFHGDCINMKQADEALVDKFICPLCEENGKGNTTWKPMCRRDGCRKPARLIKDKESKYCSDDCGVLFMSEQLQRTAGAKGANGVKDRSKKAKKKTNEVEQGEEEEPTPLGGVLRAKDLKALVDASPNIQAFKNLGTGVLSPPQTASPTQATFGGAPNGEDLALTAGETERLTALHKEKSQLNDRLEVLKDREKFVSMAKEQANRVAEREKIKVKEFCGYDSRLSWSDAEFLLWRNSKHGRAAFKFNTLSPTSEQVSSMPAINGTDTLSIDTKESVCLKKRCPKHPQWQKLNLQDARFEELEVVEAIRECEKEERSVRERARRRGAKDGLAKELTAGDGSKEERNREGWVEVVSS
ncbi:COMPASS (complex proteins associated with Set1p) component [Neocucurbitaria cava]|uniref:COMPASS (Complex proteins associated with Set1p) component n=1 Tax=Neocucurbitaria cava TaxID=798079 RepID=A0A9W8XXZ3_9PLEO|nr:COMPASS (complex proteins associated with Set1p) component [Neocucurbitaria cava]